MMEEFLQALRTARDLAPNEVARRALDSMVTTWAEEAASQAMAAERPAQG